MKHFKFERLQNSHCSQGHFSPARHLCFPPLSPSILLSPPAIPSWLPSSLPSLLPPLSLSSHPLSPIYPSLFSPSFSPLPPTKTVGRLTLITVRFFPLKVTHTHSHTGEVLCQHARPVQGTAVPFEVNRTLGNAATTKHSHTSLYQMHTPRSLQVLLNTSLLKVYCQLTLREHRQITYTHTFTHPQMRRWQKEKCKKH